MSKYNGLKRDQLEELVVEKTKFLLEIFRWSIFLSYG